MCVCLRSCANPTKQKHALPIVSGLLYLNICLWFTPWSQQSGFHYYFSNYLVSSIIQVDIESRFPSARQGCRYPKSWKSLLLYSHMNPKWHTGSMVPLIHRHNGYLVKIELMTLWSLSESFPLLIGGNCCAYHQCGSSIDSPSTYTSRDPNGTVLRKPATQWILVGRIDPESTTCSFLVRNYTIRSRKCATGKKCLIQVCTAYNLKTSAVLCVFCRIQQTVKVNLDGEFSIGFPSYDGIYRVISKYCQLHLYLCELLSEYHNHLDSHLPHCLKTLRKRFIIQH